MLTILFFGQLKEKTGIGSTQVDEVIDTNALIELLSKRYPALQESSFVVAVNKLISADNTAISPGATIALLPPYSGG